MSFLFCIWKKMKVGLFFFFSSRRRHTRCSRDWSSDVCSSDLRHVAVIMDGNGRWAAQRGQPRIAGHRAGVEAVRAAVDTGARLGLGALTLYAFSTENWKRPRYEVDALMRMLRKYLRIELAEIYRQNIRFQTIGRTEALAPRVKDEI